MSTERPKKRIKASSAAVPADPNGDQHVKIRSGLSQKASKLLVSLGIKEGESYVEIPEGSDIVVSPSGKASDTVKRDARYGEDWREKYYEKMRQLKSNMTYAWIEMLASSCGIDISAAVDSSYVDTFNRISDLQNQITQKDIESTRVDYLKKKQQKDDILNDIASFEEQKSEIGKLVTPDASATYKRLITDCLIHTYQAYVYYTVIQYETSTDEFSPAPNLKDPDVERVAKEMFRQSQRCEDLVIAVPNPLTTYIMRFLSGIYYLYLQCPTVPKYSNRSKYSLNGLLQTDDALADPIHLNHIAVRQVNRRKSPDFILEVEEEKDVAMIDDDGRVIPNSDYLKMIYAIIYAVSRVSTIDSDRRRPVPIRLALDIINQIIKTTKEEGFSAEPEKLIDVIKRGLENGLNGLNEKIERVRYTCSNRYFFSNDTTRDANIDLFIVSEKDKEFNFRRENEDDEDEDEEARETSRKYIRSHMHKIAIIIFTSCFKYKPSCVSLLLAFYLLVYSKIRLASSTLEIVDYSVERLGPTEIQALRDMLRRLSYRPIKFPQRVSVPSAVAVKRALLEKYIFPITAVTAIASKPDLERTIEQEPSEDRILPSYVGHLSPEVHDMIMQFVNRYMGRQTPINPREKSRKRKSPSAEYDDDDDSMDEDNPPTPPRVVIPDNTNDDYDMELSEFIDDEHRRGEAFSELLNSYDTSIKFMSYSTLDDMFDTKEYTKALELWTESFRPSTPQAPDSGPLPISEFVSKLIVGYKAPEELFAGAFPVVLFSVIHKFYERKVEEERKKIKSRLEDLKQSLNLIEDQLALFARGQISASGEALLDVLSSPEASLSVLQSGRFIVNPKLSRIVERIHSSITLDPLLNFKNCPLDALTTPLPGSILYQVASIFADICGTEYNRRNVSNGTIAYANNNTVRVQEQELKSSGLNLSYYHWKPEGMEMSREIFDDMKDSPVEDRYYTEFKGWFVKGDVSSLVTNAQPPKHKVTVMLTSNTSYSKYI